MSSKEDQAVLQKNQGVDELNEIVFLALLIDLDGERMRKFVEQRLERGLWVSDIYSAIRHAVDCLRVVDQKLSGENPKQD